MKLCRCGAIVSGRCDRCDPVVQHNRGFYGSHRWRKLSEKKRADDPLCEECLKADKTTATTEVHHIKPVETHPELRFDWDNLMSVCSECHDRLERECRGH